MKKNMFAVLILIVAVVNLTLNAYLVFTVIPNAERTDELITRILQIIDLELESPLPSDVNITYSIENVETYQLDQMTTNLSTGEDGKIHYAKIDSTLVINNADEKYETLNPKIATLKSSIGSIIITNVQKYTYEELSKVDTQTEVKKQILTDIQSLFDSKFIVDVTVTYLIQ